MFLEVIKIESIVSNKKECFRCHSILGLHKHHIFFGTANRKKSDKDGCWIWLCGIHHNLSNAGIHFDKKFDLEVKKLTERKWIEYYDDNVEGFIARYGKNYLD